MGSLDKSSLDLAQQDVVLGETVNIQDNEIVLNSNVTGTPTESGGVRIERGSSVDARLLWDEVTDTWKAGLVGSEIEIGSGGLSVNTKQWFVDANGNDTTGTGTEEKPYLTLQKAHDMAVAGDAINLGVGNFGGLTTAKTLSVRGIDFTVSAISSVIVSTPDFVAFDGVFIRATGGIAATAITINTDSFVIFNNCAIETTNFAASRNIVVTGAGSGCAILYSTNINPIPSQVKDIDVLNGGKLQIAGSILNGVNIDVTSTFEHLASSFNRANSSILGTELRDDEASQIKNVPAGGIAATDVQAAINELDTEKYAKTGGTITGAVNVQSANPEIKQTVTGGESIIGTKATLSNKYTLTDRVMKAAGVGGALSFDGINDYAETSTIPSYFASTDDWSIDGWVKFTSAVGDGWFASIGETGSVGVSLARATGNRLDLFVANTAGNYNESVTFNAATWYHVGVTFNGTSKIAKLYYQGSQIGGNKTVTQTWGGTTAKITIGNRSGLAGFLDGSQDETHTWNKELSAAEMLSLYNSGAGRYVNVGESGLLYGWHMDEGILETANDFSGNGKHLSLINGLTWGTGIVPVTAGIVDTTVITSEDGTSVNEEGKKTYGHCNGETKLQGKTIKHCINGVVKELTDLTGQVFGDNLTKDASAIMQWNSVTQGILIPRGTTAQRNAIITPATGLELYNTTTQALDYFDGTVWRPVLSSPKWSAAKIYSQQAGPLPLSTSFTSNGGTVILAVSGSAFHSVAGSLIQVNVNVDTILKGSLKRYTNEANSHKTLVSTVVITGLTAGSHTLELALVTGSTDVQDYFDVSVNELPF